MIDTVDPGVGGLGANHFFKKIIRNSFAMLGLDTPTVIPSGQIVHGGGIRAQEHVLTPRELGERCTIKLLQKLTLLAISGG